MACNPKDQRRNRRRSLRYPARIVSVDGRETMPCVVTDVSQTGARVKVEDGGSLPDDFILRLAGGENPRRVCHLVWRAKSQAGVRFEKEGAKAGPGAARPDQPA